MDRITQNGVSPRDDDKPFVFMFEMVFICALDVDCFSHFRFRVCFDLSFVWRFGLPEAGVQV
jgi:hypothetical protein